MVERPHQPFHASRSHCWFLVRLTSGVLRLGRRSLCGRCVRVRRRRRRNLRRSHGGSESIRRRGCRAARPRFGRGQQPRNQLFGKPGDETPDDQKGNLYRRQEASCLIRSQLRRAGRLGRRPASRGAHFRSTPARRSRKLAYLAGGSRQPREESSTAVSQQ